MSAAAFRRTEFRRNITATKMSGIDPLTMAGAAGMIELVGGAWSLDRMRRTTGG